MVKEKGSICRPYPVVSNNRTPYQDQGTFFIILIWPASLNLRQMLQNLICIDRFMQKVLAWWKLCVAVLKIMVWYSKHHCNSASVSSSQNLESRHRDGGHLKLLLSNLWSPCPYCVNSLPTLTCHFFRFPLFLPFFTSLLHFPFSLPIFTSLLTSLLHFPPSLLIFTPHLRSPPSLPPFTPHLHFPFSLLIFTSLLHFQIYFPPVLLTFTSYLQKIK